MNNSEIPFALDATGQLVDVEAVERGLACACTCVSCGGAMVAKQGAKKRWHFAHAAATNCQAGYESAIHLAVKQIISESKSLLLPSCNVTLSFDSSTCKYVLWHVAQAVEKNAYNHFARTGFARLPGRLIVFDEVLVEQAEGNIRPDLIGVINGKRLYIEVAVTHYVDDEKLKRIRSRQVPTIEIQIPEPKTGNWTLEGLRALCLNTSQSKVWIYNQRAELMAAESLKEREKAHQLRVQSEVQKAKRKAAVKRARAPKREEVPRDQFDVSHKLILCEPAYASGEQATSFVAIVMICPAYIGVDIESYGRGDYSRVQFREKLRKTINQVCARYKGESKIFDRWAMPSDWQSFIDVANMLCRECDFVVLRVDAPDQQSKSDLTAQLEHVHRPSAN